MPKQIRFENGDERLLNSVRSMLKDPKTLEWKDAKSTILYCLQFFKSALRPTSEVLKTKENEKK